MFAIKLLVQAHLFSSIFYCFIIQEHTAEDDIPIHKIKDINALFEIGDREVKLDGKENVVLLIGGTGTGKSTLSKFLRQDPTLKIQQNEADDYIFADGEAKIGNENNILSKTLFPQVDKDEQSGTFLVDCAGFEDTRHPMYDLLASFFTQKVFNKAQNMKIVVVESFERMRLSSDRTSFMRSIKQLGQLLQNGVAAFKGSIGLVATKADSSKPDEQLEKSVNVFLKSTINSLMEKRDDAAEMREVSDVQSLERQISLVQFLAAGDKVAIFRRPSEQQTPWNQPALMKNFNQIWHLILQNTRYLNTKQQQFQVSVAPETVIYIQNKLFAESEEKLKKILIEIGSSILQNLKISGEKNVGGDIREQVLRMREAVQKYAAPTSEINSILSLSEYFSHSNVDAALVKLVDLEMRKVEFLGAVIGHDVDSFRSQVTSMYGMWDNIQNYIDENKIFLNAAAILVEKSGSYKIYAKPPFTSKVTNENYSEFMMYLAGLNFDIPTFLAASVIKPTLNQLILLNHIKTEQMEQSMGVQKTTNLVKYTGKYILSSQIQNTESIQGELIIMATQKFFIDRDLTLTDTHLTIIAPIVEVIGAERTLTLKGSKGASFRTCPISGAKGIDGNPGLSSGQVKFVALDVVNAQALTIRSIGGDGSDGQPGGHGLNGKSSSHPEFASLSGLEEEIRQQIGSQNFKVDAWTPGEEKVDPSRGGKLMDVDLIVSNENCGSAPTNGADGGNGGGAAQPGALSLAIRHTATQISTESLSGKSGEGGLGGNAGQDAATCAKTAFHCKGLTSYRAFGFKRRLDKFRFTCSEVNKYNCETKFPLALKGKDGTRVPSGGMRLYKFPATASFENQAQEYCGIAAIEKSSNLADFLNYILSLPGANMHLVGGVCVKK